MRGLRLLATALAVAALTMTPSASAHPEDSAETSPCPEPQVDWQYDPETFIVWATLPASGCPAREHDQFELWVSITRYQGTSTQGVGREVLCGPFPSSAEAPGRRYACDAELAFDHPEAEEADYEVHLNYPGADGPAVTYLYAHCVSDQAWGECELEDDPS